MIGSVHTLIAAYLPWIASGSAAEVSTRLSPACCKRMADNHAIPIVLAFIRSCNRSQPHQEVLRLALLVLRNLAQCPATTHRVRPRARAQCNVLIRAANTARDFRVPRMHRSTQVFEADGSVEVLSELMQMYRDSTDIFVRALQVLAILAAEPVCLPTLKSKYPKEVSRLRTVVTLIEQKHAHSVRAPSARPAPAGGAAAAAAAAAREAAARSADLLKAALQLKALLN